MPTIEVKSSNPYQVRIDKQLNTEIVTTSQLSGAENVAIITQPPLLERAEKLEKMLAQAGLVSHVLAVPDAETGKTLEVAGRCWDQLGEWGFSRSDLIIGFGGGAATDLAGFVAAAWMRGIKVIQVPTTLLAMVDAAVGGKTGINTAAGKNLVGAFHEPIAVFIDVDHLDSLPQDEIIAGSAEIIKTGFIADPRILELYEKDPAACLLKDGYLPELIARSIAVKSKVVSQDLKESGLREILNYGHTFGHAVELRENFSWRHGNAVAVGMVFVAELANIRGLISDELVERHRKILKSIGLPTSYSQGHFEELHQGMKHDKKNRNSMIRFVALRDINDVVRLEGPTGEELFQAYSRLALEMS
ncbi:3-dehydroquinate synthase [Corynebacterium diphtheriae]|nr:3-dehydroquinate synthase [Corynebacterium diphtheriae]